MQNGENNIKKYNRDKTDISVSQTSGKQGVISRAFWGEKTVTKTTSKQLFYAHEVENFILRNVRHGNYIIYLWFQKSRYRFKLLEDLIKT